jgi:hypothetical protein
MHCKDCIYWNPPINEAGVHATPADPFEQGECRRRGPSAFCGYSTANEWCGEFEGVNSLNDTPRKEALKLEEAQKQENMSLREREAKKHG